MACDKFKKGSKAYIACMSNEGMEKGEKPVEGGQTTSYSKLADFVPSSVMQAISPTVFGIGKGIKAASKAKEVVKNVRKNRKQKRKQKKQMKDIQEIMERGN